MPIQKIGMMFYKNTRPVDIQGPYNNSFNTRSPPAKYYRKTAKCCNPSTPTEKQLVQEVYKNVKSCCDGFTSLAPRQANTAFPFDENGNRPDYYTTNSQYLQARCRTYNQQQYTHNLNTTTNEAEANCCPIKEGVCKKVVYKPNNETFSTQGAVSSSSRLARLKYNTVTTSAKYNQYRRIYRGDTSDAPLLIDAPGKAPFKNGHKTVCEC
jgi:hypothetical protein